MLSKNYNEIFFLECSNKIDFEKFEKDNDLLLPAIYKSLLERNCNGEFKESIYFEIEILWSGSGDKVKKGLQNYTIGSFDKFTDMKISYSLMAENELDGIEWFPGFKSYQAKGFIPFCEATSDIGLFELFLNCNKKENGSIYMIDRRIRFGVNDKGHPIKVKVADCLEDLIEQGIKNLDNPKFDAQRWNRIKKS